MDNLTVFDVLSLVNKLFLLWDVNFFLNRHTSFESRMPLPLTIILKRISTTFSLRKIG